MSKPYLRLSSDKAIELLKDYVDLPDQTYYVHIYQYLKKTCRVDFEDVDGDSVGQFCNKEKIQEYLNLFDFSKTFTQFKISLTPGHLAVIELYSYLTLKKT